MAGNRITSLTPTQLADLAAQMLSATSDNQPTYGVSAAQVAGLSGAKAGLLNGNAAVVSAKASYHAAVQARDLAAGETADAAASMARSIYARPGITDDLVAAAGLAPRSSSKARLVPSPPVGLLAVAQPNGKVNLTWSRAGNPEGIVFSVEAKVGAGDWALVTNTARTRLALSGYVTGATVAFRVSASKNDQMSVPSGTATLFPSGTASAPALRLAA